MKLLSGSTSHISLFCFLTLPPPTPSTSRPILRNVSVVDTLPSSVGRRNNNPRCSASCPPTAHRANDLYHRIHKRRNAPPRACNHLCHQFTKPMHHVGLYFIPLGWMDSASSTDKIDASRRRMTCSLRLCLSAPCRLGPNISAGEVPIVDDDGEGGRSSCQPS